jgi:SprT protein
LRVTAGVAYYRVNRIGLSRNLLTDAERLKKTLVHEYAHLLAWERHGQRGVGHGAPWKQAMKDLGAPPERTHCYEVERNAVRQRVTYQCQRCGAQFTRARRLPKRRKYVHTRCGGGLKLIAVERTTNTGSEA